MAMVLASEACAPAAEKTPFLVLAGPRDVVQIQVSDERGETLWVLEAASPRPFDAIWYGVVPEGFTQKAPAQGWLPRPLVPGELITTETLTLRRRFTHTGVAKSGTAMEILNYSMELVAGEE